MSKQEIEVKILEINLEATISRLEEIGAKKILESDVTTYFYQDKQNRRLRLRNIDNKNYITLKKKVDCIAAKHNKEIELTFNDMDEMKELLTELEFENYHTSKKHRISYQYQNIHYDIDKLDNIPHFIEVESNDLQSLEKGVNLLGYSMDQTNTFTERSLKEHYGIA